MVQTMQYRDKPSPMPTVRRHYGGGGSRTGELVPTVPHPGHPGGEQRGELPSVWRPDQIPCPGHPARLSPGAAFAGAAAGDGAPPADRTVRVVREQPLLYRRKASFHLRKDIPGGRLRHPHRKAAGARKGQQPPIL